MQKSYKIRRSRLGSVERYQKSKKERFVDGAITAPRVNPTCWHANDGEISSARSRHQHSSHQNPTPQIPFMPMMFKDLTLRMVLVYVLSPQARAETLANLGKMLTDGSLTHSIAATYPLADSAQAHKLVETADKMGSVVIKI